LGKGKDVTFYPNPANNILCFSNPENEFCKISILIIEGKTIKQVSKKGINEMNIEDLPAGVYLLRIVKADHII